MPIIIYCYNYLNYQATNHGSRAIKNAKFMFRYFLFSSGKIFVTPRNFYAASIEKLSGPLRSSYVTVNNN